MKKVVIDKRTGDLIWDKTGLKTGPGVGLEISVRDVVTQEVISEEIELEEKEYKAIVKDRRIDLNLIKRKKKDVN